MAEPIVIPSDLSVYLGDPNLDTDRAVLMLSLAQQLCETIVTPLPSTAAPVILGVAARAFTNVTSAHQVGLGSAQISYGAPNTTSGIGGLYLSRTDIRTLRRLGGRSGAFSIDLLPDPYPTV